MKLFLQVAPLSVEHASGTVFFLKGVIVAEKY